MITRRIGQETEEPVKVNSLTAPIVLGVISLLITVMQVIHINRLEERRR